MTDADFPAFEALVQRLRFVFRHRQTTDEFSILCSSYFKALHNLSLEELAEAADRWIANGKGFPRPQEWRDQVPRQHMSRLPMATDMEARLARDAARRHWEDTPCLCKECVQAGVSDLPRRFVPLTSPDGRDRRYQDPLSGQPFVAGRWLHGQDLALWHLARERFRDQLMAFCKVPIIRALKRAVRM